MPLSESTSAPLSHVAAHTIACGDNTNEYSNRHRAGATLGGPHESPAPCTARMIARVWWGRSTTEKAHAYVAHVRDNVFPELRAISGHRGLLTDRDTTVTHFDIVRTTA